MVLLNEGEIVAGISVLKKSLPLPGRSIFYAPRGPIVPFDDQKLLGLLLEPLKGEAKRNKAVLLRTDPPIEEGHGVEEILKKNGFVRNSKQIQPRTTYYLDLKIDLDDLLKTFEEKTRYNIRLSERKGVQVRQANTLDGVRAYYDLYKETSARDNFLIHPLKYYQNIKNLLIDRGLASVFLAYYKEKPIAGIFIFHFGKKIWYMYGASSAEFRNVMPNHALHWHVIKWAKEAGYEIYDLWGIPSNPKEGHPLWGVYRFKKGFNGRLVKYIGVYDLPFNPILYHAFEKGLAFYKNMRSLIKKGKISDSLAE